MTVVEWVMAKAPYQALEIKDDQARNSITAVVATPEDMSVSRSVWQIFFILTDTL
jgi:hypothetical protein